MFLAVFLRLPYELGGGCIWWQCWILYLKQRKGFNYQLLIIFCPWGLHTYTRASRTLFMSFMIGLCFFMYRRKPVNCQCDTKMIGWDCFGQVIAIKELLWLKSSLLQVTIVAGYYRNILHSYHGYIAVQKTSYPWLLRSHQRILLAASFIIWMLYITMITVNRYFDVDTWKIAKYRNIYI